MRMLMKGLLIAPLLISPALAGELSSISRTIVEEPEYQSKTPLYCLMAFGHNADTRIWLVLDGDVIYVDKNRNGNLTDEGEKFVGKLERAFGPMKIYNFKAGDIEEAGSNITHTNLSMRAIVRNNETRAAIKINLNDDVEYGNNAHLLPMKLSGSPETAPIVHYGGPRTMGLYMEPARMNHGEEQEFYTMIGTAGIGFGSFAAMNHKYVPPGLQPVAQFKFPPSEAGGKPIEIEVSILHRC